MRGGEIVKANAYVRVRELVSEWEVGMRQCNYRNLTKELDIRVSGANAPRPVKTFSQMNLPVRLSRAIEKQGYEEPTPIQKQAVPVGLSGRDLIGIAKTGSGKTAAFMWPLLVHVDAQRGVKRGEGPIAVVVAPTRELAHQIYMEGKKFSKKLSVRLCPIYGGVSKAEQIKQLKAGVEVLVCTPGRLMDFMRMKKITSMRRVTFLVLDEADRMFDMGFEPQVRSIAGQIRPDRQSKYSSQVSYLWRYLT